MGADRPISMFGPDFTFAFDDWLAHPAGLGALPAERHGAPVAVIGAGVAGIVAAAGTAKDCGRRERFWFGLILPTMHLCWGAGFLRGLVTGAGSTKDGSR